MVVLTILCSLTAVNAADSLNETAATDNDIGILTIENEVSQSGTDELNAINADDVQSISKNMTTVMISKQVVKQKMSLLALVV